jgi:hypothetical protein
MFEIVKRMIMKDPRDRFQDSDELVRALEGQPLTTPTAAGRASAVETVSRLGIATQPTSPLPGLADSSGLVTAERQAARRPVGRRSVVHEPAAKRPWAWVAIGVLLAGGAGSAFYYQSRHGQSTVAVTDSTVGGGGPASDSARRHSDSASSLEVATRDSLHHADSVAHSSPPGAGRDSGNSGTRSADSTKLADPTAIPDVRIIDTAERGGLHLTGLPAGSTILIDAKPVLDPNIRLPAGAHELAITAPGFQFYKDTIEIEGGQTLQMAPELARFGQPVSRPEVRRPRTAAMTCEVPSALNRFGRACYDDPPRPIGSTRVALTPDIEGTPSASIFLVKVSADGKTLRVVTRTPSGDPAFERLAHTFAEGLEWTPAKKGGTTVNGWTQLVVQPGQ